MDHLTHFVSQYGYWAVAVGCLLEGETVMVLAGLAARRGLLDLPLVMALGSAMGALGDITMFSLGRWRGAALWGFGVAGAGWLFGHAAEALLGEVHDAEQWIVLALVALLGGVALWRWWRHRA